MTEKTKLMPGFESRPRLPVAVLTLSWASLVMRHGSWKEPGSPA